MRKTFWQRTQYGDIVCEEGAFAGRFCGDGSVRVRVVSWTYNGNIQINSDALGLEVVMTVVLGSILKVDL